MVLLVNELLSTKKKEAISTKKNGRTKKSMTLIN
jgi:hypothetical protein